MLDALSQHFSYPMIPVAAFPKTGKAGFVYTKASLAAYKN